MTVQVEQIWIQAPGAKLFMQIWKPEKPTATLTFVHGLGENIERYHEMFEYFARNGILVRGFDQRGFGQTARLNGYHGYGGTQKSMFADIKLVSDSTRTSNLSHFLMGHSMGGALVLKYAMEHTDKFAGIISSAPCTAPGKDTDISGIEKAGARLLSKVLPSFCVYNPISIATLTRDKDELNKYKNSPLVHSYISLSLAGDFANFEPYFSNKANSDKIKSPLLVMHGSADRMTSPESSKRFVESQKVFITN